MFCRNIQRIFLEQNIQFKSFLLEEEKPVRIILRGLTPNTSVDNTQSAVAQEGYNNVTITQMYRGSISNKKIYAAVLTKHS